MSCPCQSQQQILVGLKMSILVLRCFMDPKVTLWGKPDISVGPGWRKVTTICFWKTETSSASSTQEHRPDLLGSQRLPERPKCVFQATAVPVSTSDLEVWLEQWITQWVYLSASMRPWASCRNKAPSVCECQNVWRMRYICICTTRFVQDLWREHLIRAACSITPTQKNFVFHVSLEKNDFLVLLQSFDCTGWTKDVWHPLPWRRAPGLLCQLIPPSWLCIPPAKLELSKTRASAGFKYHCYTRWDFLLPVLPLLCGLPIWEGCKPRELNNESYALLFSFKSSSRCTETDSVLHPKLLFLQLQHCIGCLT